MFDAISQYEQEARVKGQEERNAQWRLFYRKELFNPWSFQVVDPVSIYLIYEQIIRGLHYNEVRYTYRIDALLL